MKNRFSTLSQVFRQYERREWKGSKMTKYPSWYTMRKSRSQRLRSFWSAWKIINLYKNPKKPIYDDWPIKTCSSHANFFANQKTASKFIWFWQVIRVQINLIRLKTVKKKGYLEIKPRNHPTMTFYSKFFSLILTVSQCYFKRFYTFMLVNLSYLHPAVAHSEHERMCRNDQRMFQSQWFKKIWIFCLVELRLVFTSVGVRVVIRSVELII